MMRRCIIPEHGMRLLEDLGCNPNILAKQIRPAKKWKITTLDLHTIRDGDAYPGCAPSEPVYCTTEGQLVRVLRQEFLRYGGEICWGSVAREPYPSPEVKESWCLAKDFGPLSDAEMLLSTAKEHKEFQEVVFAPPEPDARVAVFDVRSGVFEAPNHDLQVLLGHDYDFAIAMGKRVVLHVWMPRAATFAWRLVTSLKEDEKRIELLHPALQHMMANSRNVQHEKRVIPASTPQFNENLFTQRVSVLGDALLPVDPFEWRGDRAMADIEGASELTQAIYGRKFYRGNVAAILREIETDQLMRRADFLRRDMRDAEMFLAERPELEENEDDAEPQLKRVGA